MKKAKVVVLCLGAILGIMGFALKSYADIVIKQYGYAGGRTQVVSETRVDTFFDYELRFDCSPAYSVYGACSFCGACHTSNTDAELGKRLTQRLLEEHRKTYFLKHTLALSEGQKLAWGREGDYYILEGGQLVRYDKDKKRIWVAPRGSRILKNSKGKVAFVLFNGKPIISRR